MEIPFRVVHCGGEDPNYPASELNPESVAAGSRGWQTARHCKYPVELGLELLSDAPIEQMKLLSHQSKIATRIEIFVGEGANYGSVNFRRLGYMSLDSNARSRYQARELKTVYLKTPARFIKLLVHECHGNKYNLFNQVGVVSVSFAGDASAAVPKVESAFVREGNPGPRAPAAAAGLDEELAQRLERVASSKQRAVEVEDYDSAKRLKALEGLLDDMVAHYVGLAEDKYDAVGVEDYDRAKELKAEMEDFRELILRRVDAIEAGATRDEVLGLGRSAPSPAAPGPYDQDESYDQDASFGAPSPFPDPDDRPMRPLSAAAGGAADAFAEDREDESGAASSSSSAEGDASSGPHPLEGVAKCEELPAPERLLSPEEVSPWVEMYGEYVVRCLKSSTWQLRDAGVLKCALLVPSHPSAAPALARCTLRIAAEALQDKIAQVSYSALLLLKELVKRCEEDGVPRSALWDAGLEGALALLALKAGDGNARLRDQACGALLGLAASRAVGLAAVGHVCCRRMAPKQQNSPRSLVSRIALLRDLVEGRGLPAGGAFGPEAVLGFLKAANAFAHSNAQVRDAARELAVAVYAAVGHAPLAPYLAGLRPKQQQEYQAAFDLYEELQGGGAYAGDYAQDEANPEDGLPAEAAAFEDEESYEEDAEEEEEEGRRARGTA